MVVAVAIAADGGVAAGPGVGEAAADHGARLAGCATAEQPVGMMSSAEFATERTRNQMKRDRRKAAKRQRGHSVGGVVSSQRSKSENGVSNSK